MATFNCPECGQMVSAHATKCPHCGYPLGKNGRLGERQTSAAPEASQYGAPLPYNVPARKSGGNNTVLIVVLIIVLACVLTVGGYFVFSSLNKDNPPQHNVPATSTEAETAPQPRESERVGNAGAENTTYVNVPDINMTGDIAGSPAEMHLSSSTQTGWVLSSVMENVRRNLTFKSLNGQTLVINATLNGKYIGYYKGTYDGSSYKGVFYNTRTGGKVNFSFSTYGG